MASISDLAQAIAQFEGFNTAGSIAQRNNNPGNLRSWGNYPVVGGFAQFPDAATGWAALESQVTKTAGLGLTLEEFFAGKPGVYAGYAPAADSNQPASYAATVAGWLGISASVPLTDALDGGSSSDASGSVASSLLGDNSGVTLAAAGIGLASLAWLLFR